MAAWQMISRCAVLQQPYCVGHTELPAPRTASLEHLSHMALQTTAPGLWMQYTGDGVLPNGGVAVQGS